MTNKNLTIGLVIAILIAVSGLFLPHVSSKLGFGAVNTTDGSATNFTEVTASNGMQILSGGLSYGANGLTVTDITLKQNMLTGTTTVCSFQLPNATTTFKASLANVVVGSTTASNLLIAYTTTANTNASTTKIAQLSGGANSTQVVVATSSLTNLTDNILAPNSLINVSRSGGAGTFSDTGICQLTYQTAN